MMRPVKVTINPGEEFSIGGKGNYVRVKKSSVTLRVKNPDDDTVALMDEGDDFEFSDFTSIVVSHEDAAAQQIILIITVDKKGSAAKVSGNVNVGNFPVDQSTVSSAGITAYQATVNTSSTQVLSPNAARRYLAIQNKSQYSRVYVNFGAAANTQHLVLEPGEEFEFNVAPTGGLNLAAESNGVLVTVIYG